MPLELQFHAPFSHWHFCTPILELCPQARPSVEHVAPCANLSASQDGGPETQELLVPCFTQWPPVLLHVEIVWVDPFATHVAGPSSGQ